MKYNVKTSSQEITANTTIKQSKFGGWLCVNIGNTGIVYVDGYPLNPGDGIDMTHLAPEVVWAQPIRIIVTGGATARFTSLYYTEVKERR